MPLDGQLRGAAESQVLSDLRLRSGGLNGDFMGFHGDLMVILSNLIVILFNGDFMVNFKVVPRFDSFFEFAFWGKSDRF